MSKERPVVLDVGQISRDTKHRHSLQPATDSQIESNFRHTQSQNYDKKKRRARVQAPPLASPIKEQESPSEEDDHVSRISVSCTNEVVRNSMRSTLSEKSRSKRHSKESRRSKNSGAYDNAGFEGDAVKTGSKLSRNNSATNSVRSSNQSLQSLTVVREQYWCCSQRSPCERLLFASVAILSVIILILVVVIIIIATNGSGEEVKRFFKM